MSLNIKIQELANNTEEQYSEFLKSIPTSLVYHSINYRNFLRDILEPSQDRYLLAFENNILMAALPIFIKRARLGSVVNSLPFFGSNGSIIAKIETSYQTKKNLINKFNEICQEEDAIASTIVTNPLENSQTLFDDYSANLFDDRIGQFTSLPNVENHLIEENLMSSFHVKTRNMIRKGLKSGFELRHDGSEETMLRLYTLHELNMKSIGGRAKPWIVFQSIQKNFVYDQDYRIYTASKDNAIVSCLLVFFFNKTAEYFTPVIQEEYRTEQPLSALIFIAMKDTVLKGCTWWNWGGTWLSQDGVYRFKSRWGTSNFPYKYLIKEYKDNHLLRNLSSDDLLAMYPYFYVLPFNTLNKK
jgi:hypothetical protein